MQVDLSMQRAKLCKTTHKMLMIRFLSAHRNDQIIQIQRLEKRVEL